MIKPTPKYNAVGGFDFSKNIKPTKILPTIEERVFMITSCSTTKNNLTLETIMRHIDNYDPYYCNWEKVYALRQFINEKGELKL